jgi:hypothetical protein
MLFPLAIWEALLTSNYIERVEREQEERISMKAFRKTSKRKEKEEHM